MKSPWRLIFNKNATASDLVAYPASIVEGEVAGKYILSSKPFKNTLIMHEVNKPGLLIGTDVDCNYDEADKRGIDIAIRPRGGRSGIKPADAISYDELIMNADDNIEDPISDEKNISAIIYTSGTSGTPKGVVLTNSNFNAENRATESIIPTDSTDKFASLVPFFHIFGLADGCVIPFMRGALVFLVPQYAPKKFLHELQKEKITVVLGIPDQYKHLLRVAGKLKNDIKLSIKYAISGADKLPENLISEFKDKLNVNLIEGYGMTETTAAVTINIPEKIKVGSIGVEGRGVNIRVVDEDGKEIKPYESGELKIRGDVVTPGYYNLEEETLKVIKNGWLYTGDIGYRDEDNYFFITDRKKDLIIKSGFNISPAEIEKTICKYDGVKDAAVIPFTKTNGKHGIKLFCSLKGGRKIESNELLKYCRDNLINYKVPDEVEIINKIPKSMSGKVLRKELYHGYIDQRLIKRE